MPFLIKMMNQQENEIWSIVINNLKKEVDSGPVHNEKYLKALTKPYNGKMYANFHKNKIPNEGSQCICLLIILIDSDFRTGKIDYPQVFLEECC